MNPFGKIKDLTRGAASVGMHVAGQATKSAATLTAGAVSKLVQGRKPTVSQVTPDAKAPEPATERPLAPEPVTRTQAPPRKSEPATEPLTSIDASADTAHVDATPADLAKKVARKAPGRPTAKKAPAKKTSPGAKLPARKKVDESQPPTG